MARTLITSVKIFICDCFFTTDIYSTLSECSIISRIVGFILVKGLKAAALCSLMFIAALYIG